MRLKQRTREVASGMNVIITLQGNRLKDVGFQVRVLALSFVGSLPSVGAPPQLTAIQSLRAVYLLLCSAQE
jgi:hypothetical protein